MVELDERTRDRCRGRERLIELALFRRYASSKSSVKLLSGKDFSLWLSCLEALKPEGLLFPGSRVAGGRVDAVKLEMKGLVYLRYW